MNSAEPGRRAATERWPDVMEVPSGQSRVRIAMAAAAIDPAARRMGIRVRYPDGRVRGSHEPQAPLLRLHRPEAMYRRVVAAGLIGFGESYQAGEWDADDLPGLLAKMAARAEGPHPLKALLPASSRMRLPRSGSSRAMSDRSTVRRHIELPNEFFALLLDETMTYSSALFAQGADGRPLSGAALLADAQRRKINRVLDIARVGKGTSLLEFGTGWGELAIMAARRGASVRTITDSPSQRALAQERITAAGLAGRIQLEFCGYQDARPSSREGYDAVVSVEMIEAVGEECWPGYLGTLERNLARGGRIVLQTITMRDEHLQAARGRYTWINKYVRSGGQIPSVTAIEEACHQHPGLRVQDADAFGAHYAHTFALWRERFAENGEALASLGFDEIFRRTWSLYLAFREASFSSGYLDVHHLVLDRSGHPPDRGHAGQGPDGEGAPAAERPYAPAAETHRARDAGDVASGETLTDDATRSPGDTPTSRWVSLGGQVHYADYGGPRGKRVLVCVHGIGGSGETWAAIAPELARSYRVLAVDLAGFGRSKGNGLAASMPANQVLLHRFLLEVVGGPAVLVGHSMGGTLAAILAAQHPELASGLVLIDPAVPWVRDEIDRRLTTARATLAQAFRTGRWQTGAPAETPADADAGTPVSATESVLTARIMEQYLIAARRSTRSRSADADLLVATRSLATILLRRREFAAMLSGISTPVLWLHGENDPAVPVGAARDTARIRPTWQFHVAPNIGHEPHRQAPDWTIGHIRSWLDLTR
jgi:cyclopropane-fatty-acyl-phospholipid synthase